jgi:hypothetical protein
LLLGALADPGNHLRDLWAVFPFRRKGDLLGDCCPFHQFGQIVDGSHTFSSSPTIDVNMQKANVSGRPELAEAGLSPPLWCLSGGAQRSLMVVTRDGIHCHGLRYFSITLAPYVGEPVTIRYDPRDLAEIRVYHRDKFLCRAVSPDIASVTVSLQDLQAARNQRRRELRQQLTARRSLVELLTQPGPESARGQTTRKKTPAADTTNRAVTRLKLYRED